MRKSLLLLLIPAHIFSTEGKFGSETALGYSLSNPDVTNYFNTYHKTSWSDEITNVRFKTTYMAAIKKGAVANSNGTFEFGYDRILNSRWTVFAFTDVWYGIIKTMNTLTFVGSGLKYASIKTDSFIFDTSIAPIYQRDLQVDSTDIASFSISLRNRGSWVVTAGHTLILTHFYTFSTTNSQNQFHMLTPQYWYSPVEKITLKVSHQYTYSLLTATDSGFTSAQAVFSF